jgi:hypothetical protein
MEIDFINTYLIYEHQSTKVSTRDFNIEIRQYIKEIREISIKIQYLNSPLKETEESIWKDINQELKGKWEEIEVYSSKEFSISINRFAYINLGIKIKYKKSIPLYKEKDIYHFVLDEQSKHYIEYTFCTSRDLLDNRLKEFIILCKNLYGYYAIKSILYSRYIIIPNGYMELYIVLNDNNLYKKRKFLYCLLVDSHYDSLIYGAIIKDSGPFLSTWESIGAQVSLEQVGELSNGSRHGRKFIPVSLSNNQFEITNPEEVNPKNYLYKIIER